MTKAFEFKRGDLNKLRKFYKAAPGMFKRASAGLSNNLAFRARGMILEEIEQSMTVRSPGFIRGSVRVQKARFNNPTAEVGSIKRDRFSGWIEQQTGRKTTRTRTQSKIARRNDWRKRVAPRFRFKPGKSRSTRPSDFGLSDTSGASVPIFLQILNRKKHRQMFYIPIRYKRLQRGIYIFRAKKIRRVHNLEPDNPQPKKNPWMTRVVNQINQPVVEQEWQRSVKFFASKIRL